VTSPDLSLAEVHRVAHGLVDANHFRFRGPVVDSANDATTRSSCQRSRNRCSSGSDMALSWEW
jgi:hypothetical protein